jgi:hypothetical protein
VEARSFAREHAWLGGIDFGYDHPFDELIYLQAASESDLSMRACASVSPLDGKKVMGVGRGVVRHMNVDVRSCGKGRPDTRAFR